MVDTVRKDHPKQRLLFYVSHDVDEDAPARIRSWVLELSTLRSWSIGPPTFIEAHEDLGTAAEDAPIETIGGYLEMYSALPPWKLPHDVDSQHFEDVSFLVARLCEFSKRFSVSFELELDDTFVGTINDGVMDRTLSQGLLEEWRKQLGSSA